MISSFQTFVPTLMGNGSSTLTGQKAMELGCRNVLVVYDKGLEDTGIVGQIIDNLISAGLKVTKFNGVLPEPPESIVEEGSALAREAAVDGIIAVGGGSSIDTAKAINILMNNPLPISQYFGFQPNLNRGVKLIFIPTTSGTGSEMTSLCVISSRTSKKKDSILSPVCMADLAILDPELTIALPASITAATGVDAFTHAVESMTGKMENPLSDALAREAIHMITKWLPPAIANGKNHLARENMILASSWAGLAFTNALLHLGHGIAHSIGAVYHIPHGIACSLALPEVIQYAAQSKPYKVQQICECMDITIPEHASPTQIGEIARREIRRFLKNVGMPNMKELNIPKSMIPKIAFMVISDSSFTMIPHEISAAEVENLLRHAYNA